MKYMRGYENGFGLIQKPKHAFLTDSLGRSSFLLQIMAGGAQLCCSTLVFKATSNPLWIDTADGYSWSRLQQLGFQKSNHISVSLTPHIF